ncbi:hypothetical protein Are01nite_72860 [Actinoplanes regularis]|nr:hypothetical protein Are01nite_72860 [Actinoplanes regularis]
MLDDPVLDFGAQRCGQAWQAQRRGLEPDVRVGSGFAESQDPLELAFVEQRQQWPQRFAPQLRD